MGRGRTWAALGLLIGLAGGCGTGEELPEPGTARYEEAVRAFHVGLAALQAGDDERAVRRLDELTRLVPEEPAGWVNRGVLALRHGDLELAEQKLEHAAALAPDTGRIQYVLGTLHAMRGRSDRAVAHLRRAVELDGADLKARFALAEEVERRGDPEAHAEAESILAEIQAVDPDNLVVLLERARLAARRADADALAQRLAEIAALRDPWPDRVLEQLAAVEEAAGDPRQAATQVGFLRNVLVSEPEYRSSRTVVQTPPTEPGEVMAGFLRLRPPTAEPAPPDEELGFELDRLVPDRWVWAGALYLDAGSPPMAVRANAETVELEGQALPFPDGGEGRGPGMAGVVALDWNNDFHTDLLLVGSGGLRLFEQQEGRFSEVTDSLGLSGSVLEEMWFGAWPLDIEADGDLDVVAAPLETGPRLLRNNGDGTFEAMEIFDRASAGLRDLAWGDLTGEGVPDAALVDREGRLHVYANRRGGLFEPVEVEGVGPARAVAIADLDRTGRLDLLVLEAGGDVLQLTWDRLVGGWQQRPVASWSGMADWEPGKGRLLVADLDNNGALDLIVSKPTATRIWLGDQAGGFVALEERVSLRTFAVADLDGDGRLDLLGICAEGGSFRAVNRSTSGYQWQVVRPRAARTAGDQRINSFGVGGEMEIRAGLLFQKQVIGGPAVHFGLGEQTMSDVVRIIWPNGSVQAEFELDAQHAVQAEQRLKGSCPWIFAWDGQRMGFVTDFLWRSPLGMQINAQETARIVQTEDWVRIGSDQLVQRDGRYDVRITAELWETHFVDHASLKVIDHPEGTEVFADERFAVPPAPLELHAVRAPRAIRAAWDDEGRDVSSIVRQRNRRYLDTFGLGPYQGLTRDHYVEVDLGDEVDPQRPLVLLAHGWIRPTDSSINVALGQGDHDPPRGLSLEVPDGAGGWRTAHPDLGFPTGKHKTVVIDLTGQLPATGPARVRLRTNLEIYWDQIQWAEVAPPDTLKVRRLAPEVAELRYRGYSAVSRANHSSPELPDYERLATTRPQWRDLVGFHTRFGDVRELLEAVDNRYVIMNAGDELKLLFEAPAPPEPGWQRTYVLVGDGWVKDGDYNTAFSKTVLPLPEHGRPEYDTPPGRLQDDPVYRRFPEDWLHYHTRYVTPERFRKALVVEPEEPR